MITIYYFQRGTYAIMILGAPLVAKGLNEMLERVSQARKKPYTRSAANCPGQRPEILMMSPWILTLVLFGWSSSRLIRQGRVAVQTPPRSCVHCDHPRTHWAGFRLLPCSHRDTRSRESCRAAAAQPLNPESTESSSSSA